MGGGDLNLKKSWHPHTMKNQEKVWKAEQAKNAEDRKMKDLRREILEEKNREDLLKIGQSSGVLAKTDDKKLEWMYKSSSELINREDYLLGRQIDRAFETMDAEERNKDLVGVKVPVNHVEHECIPFSIRSYRNATSNEQVDLQRKILEDPLMMIKQKEMESRRKILENPVKLKELHRILKIEKTTKSKSSKESKKNKKKKKKSKKKSSDSDDSDDSDKDLDAMLQKQYNKLKDKDSKQLAGLDLSKLLDAKYKTISKELDKAVDSKKKKKKSKKKSKKSSSSNESQSDSDDDGRQDSRDKADNRSYRNQRERSRSPLGRRDQRRDGDRHQGIERRNWNDEGRNRNYSSYNRSQRRSRSQSPSRKQVSRRRSRSQSPSRRQQFHRRSRSQSPSKRQQSHRRSRSQSPSRRQQSHRRSSSQSPSRRQQSHRRSKSPVQTNHSQSSRSRENREDRTKKNQTQKERLTEEEKEKRLKDMMENAAWRDKERTRNVQKYRDGYNKEEQQNQAREFDKEFINTQLRKAMSTTSSVESRIKSNINNIQRTSAAMNANFARK